MGALDLLFQAKAQYRRAEQMSRAALSIVERTKGEMAPELATRLNNLAHLLQATNRLGEAEPLMRRPGVIFLMFQRDTGHSHPHREAVLNNYAMLLKEMGRSDAEIAAEHRAMMREAGLA